MRPFPGVRAAGGRAGPGGGRQSVAGGSIGMGHIFMFQKVSAKIGSLGMMHGSKWYSRAAREIVFRSARMKIGHHSSHVVLSCQDLSKIFERLYYMA